MTLFDIASLEEELHALEKKTEEPSFWEDSQNSSRILKRINELKNKTENYKKISSTFEYIEELNELVKSEIQEGTNKEELELEAKEIIDTTEKLEKDIEKLEITTLLSGKYDSANAIVEIHPGAGGTESQDWAEMLYRMYQRYCSSKDFKIEVLDYLDGDVAGIKSVTFLVKGKYAYGHLKAEKGVHRLVRISPFDSSKRRHTSFASIDVIPELDDTIEIDIKPEDLRIDTYRASGAGGQHINKTDSAVRITHIPTGTVVTCQSQRSQIQNREQAMIMLKSKLFALMEEKQAKELKEIQGEQKEIAWGSQIRSYVLHPYSLVKDNRSLYESNNPKDVLDGNLDDFIYAYLKSRIQEGGHEE